MNRKLLLALLLLLTQTAVAQEEIRRITFHTVPECEVVLEVSGNSPYVLGRSNVALPLDMEIFSPNRTVRVTFRREGWFPATHTLQQAPVKTRYFETRDRYPEASQGALRLTAKTDFRSRLLQLRYYAWRERWPLAVMLLLAGVGSTLGWRRWQRVKGELQRAQALEKLTANLDGSDPLAGQILGKYRLLEPLGAGGMATVYRAVPNDELEQGEAVAVKVLHWQLAKDPEAGKRFRREIKLYCELQHPSLVPIYDWGDGDGMLFIVNELLEGETMRERMRRDFPDWREGVAWMLELLDCLDYVHGRKVVHRDLKPDNLFLTERGLRLMDFGVARAAHLTAATATGQGIGTPAYMAPEQLSGQFDARTDLYAVGVMLYELSVGEPPFYDPDPTALAFMQAARSPEPVRRLRPDLPATLETIIMRLLEKDPDKRFADAASVSEALRSLGSD